jgi:uncharacterized protein (TIGR03437 family)
MLIRSYVPVGKTAALLFLAAAGLLAVQAAAPPTVLFQETFEDPAFASRGWYDSDASVALSSVEHIPGSARSYQAQFQAGKTTPATPRRHAFAETSSVYLSFWVKFSSNWIGSGKPYHPHFMHLLTNKNGAYSGLAWTHLTTYVEFNGGTPKMGIQDGQNIGASMAGDNRAVAGCNGSCDAYPAGECYSCAPNRCNGKLWAARQKYFSDNPGPYYKGDWHHIEAYFQLNTISPEGHFNRDGVLQYFYDGIAVIDVHDAVLRTGQHPDMKFNQFVLAPYIGDGSPVDQTIWVDDLVVATRKPDLAAQSPAVLNGGVVNAASFAAGQAVAPGSLVSIFGANLAATAALAAFSPLPTSLGGATVMFNGIPAPLVAVFPNLPGDTLSQVNAQLPWNVLPARESSGTVDLIVTVNGVPSVRTPVQVNRFSPGIFSFQSGAGQAAATTADGTALIAPESFRGAAVSRPARIGEVITFYATGLGPVDFPPNNGETPGRMAATITTPAVLIGGVPAPVQFSGLAPCCVGLNQVNVQVPAGAPPGDAVPLQIQLGGTTTTGKVTIAVAR